jgi:hypothetical protein
MGTYPVKEKAKDAGIKVAHIVFGTMHFTTRLLADGFRECEAQMVHLIDNGCEKDLVRKQRDKKYADRIEDFKARIEETRKVMDETYERVTKNISTEELVFMEEITAPLPPQ